MEPKGKLTPVNAERGRPAEETDQGGQPASDVERPGAGRVVHLSDDYEAPTGQPDPIKAAPGLVASTVPKTDMAWATDVAQLTLVKVGDRLPGGKPIILNEDEIVARAGLKEGDFLMVAGDYVVIETEAHHELRVKARREKLDKSRQAFETPALQSEIATKAPGVPAEVIRFEQKRVADEQASEIQEQIKAEQPRQTSGG